MYFKLLLANKVCLSNILFILIGIFLPYSIIYILIGIYSFFILSGIGYPSYSSYHKCKKYLSSQLNKDKPDLICRYFNVNQKLYCNNVGLRVAQYEINNNKSISYWNALIFF